VRQKTQLLFIALVIIAILAGEALVYVPSRSTTRSVVIEAYTSTTALVQALTNGEIDIAPIENAGPRTLSQLKNNPNLNVVPIGNFGFTYIGLNLRNPPLNSSVFRRAMLYGFNRDRLLSGVLAGYGETLGPGLFSTAYATLGWRNEPSDMYPYSPERASQLLDSIGFVRSPSGVRVDPSTGQQLRTMFIYSKLSDPQSVAAANLFAEDMRSIGLPIISLPATDFDFAGIRVNYYFDLFIDTETAGPGPTWLDDLFAGVNDVYPVPHSTDLVGYHNSAFDENAKQLMTASDSASAREAALKCQEQLSLDVPAIPVYSKSLLIVTQKSLPQITPITGSIPDTIAGTLTNMTGEGLVRIGEVSGLTDVNPATGSAAADSLTLRLITEPLLTYAADGSLQPGLVGQWAISENSTTLSLVLRDGVRFQDGTTITAHDLAATLDWLVKYTVPSATLYPTVSKIKSVAEVDDHTVTISLLTSNRFAAYAFANSFALPANPLPTMDAPLALLLTGSLKSSGAFSLTRFVQGAEAELRSNPAGNQPTINGAQGQEISGARIGGSQIQIFSQPLTYKVQSIDNATFTVQVYDSNGGSEATIQGSYFSLGIYRANWNLNDQPLPVGVHRVVIQLFAQLPSGAFLQFNEEILTVHAPLLAWQIAVYALAMGLTLFTALALPSGLRSGKGIGPSRRLATKKVNYCRKCGAKLGPRSKFCLKCGAKVRR
jgi:ABC-type transport system substrate-binding protein/ribosomal protein L40E